MKKVLRKVEHGSTLSNEFWLCCSFFIKFYDVIQLQIMQQSYQGHFFISFESQNITNFSSCRIACEQAPGGASAEHSAQRLLLQEPVCRLRAVSKGNFSISKPVHVQGSAKYHEINWRFGKSRFSIVA